MDLSNSAEYNLCIFFSRILFPMQIFVWAKETWGVVLVSAILVSWGRTVSARKETWTSQTLMRKTVSPLMQQRLWCAVARASVNVASVCVTRGQTQQRWHFTQSYIFSVWQKSTFTFLSRLILTKETEYKTFIMVKIITFHPVPQHSIKLLYSTLVTYL